MLTKPFLIIQLRPEDEASDNEFNAFLQVGEIKKKEAVRLRIEETGIPKLKLDSYSAIIVGGSPFDIRTPQDKKSAIQKKIEKDFHDLLDQVVAKDFPFLGACSGCGILGSYCGAKMSGRYSEPVGGVDETLTKEGKKDPLLKGLPTQFRALVGHKEACDDTPPGAVLLASSKTCPVQMFRLKNNIYATQFHPEADGEVFKLRINIYKHHGYFSPDEAENLIANVLEEKTPIPKEILKRFVNRYRTARTYLNQH